MHNIIFILLLIIYAYALHIFCLEDLDSQRDFGRIKLEE